MVQIAVKIPGEGGECDEWAMIEMQGELETRHPVPLSGKLIGDLHFTHGDVPILIIGHHILYGKVVPLEKPFAVLVKDTAQGHGEPMEDDGQSKPRTQTEYHVKAIIRKKLLFKTRPKPIIANVPKKL
ncbi:chromosome transmission fidelity protein 8 homolog [Babylonia areolata]|uniref:chromosome transmission fidelity protein 8 homolog n=1 Tax=Babylonia areolata TaxID=304850 RepID=UPI003FD67241